MCDEMIGTGNSESSESERMNEGIKWKEVKREKVMGYKEIQIVRKI